MISKSLFFVSLFSILFYSCQSDDNSNNSVTNEKEELENITNTLSIESDSYVMNLFDYNFIEHLFEENTGKEIKTIKEKENVKFGNKYINDTIFNNLIIENANNPEIIGPFTKEFSHVSTLDNQTIIWQGGEGLATGMYIADILIYNAEVQLPQNSVGIVNSANNYGYTNYSNQNLGYHSGHSSSNGNNLFIVTTYFIKIKYNALGQSMGSFIYPSIAAYNNPKEINYSYITY